MKNTITINGKKFKKVRIWDVIQLVNSGNVIYELDNNELELLHLGIDRVQNDLIYVTPLGL